MKNKLFALALALFSSVVSAQGLGYSFGSMAYQNSDSVSIAGGTVSGLTLFNASRVTTATTAQESLYGYLTVSPASDSAAVYSGTSTGINVTGAANFTAYLLGIGAFLTHSGSGLVDAMYGADLEAGIGVSGTGDLTLGVGAYVGLYDSGAGTIVEGRGLEIGNIPATTDWSVYSSGATDTAYFAGDMLIGTLDAGLPLTVTSLSATANALELRSARAALVGLNTVSGISFRSNDTSLTAPGTVTAQINAFANETHTASALGTRLSLYATGQGSTSPVETLRVSGILSGVNFLQATAAVTTTSPTLSAGGADTDINLQLSGKGVGTVMIGDSCTATASAGAATCSAQRMVITSESLTTAAGTDYNLTVTNTRVTSSSIILCSGANGTNSTEGVGIRRTQPGSGSFVVRVRNDNTLSAFNGTVKVSCVVH